MDPSTQKLTFSLQKHTHTSSFPSSILKVTQNDDLLTSILSLLPSKSVTRFKVVSKHWLSLISHSSFSLLHTTHSPPQPPSALLFPDPTNETLFHSFPLNFENCTFTPSTSLNFTNDPSGEIELIQSCNGLLLCSSGSPFDGIENRIFYIFNPTTKKFNTLPPPTPPNLTNCLSIFTKISLVFDPSRSPYYKVVLLRKSDGRRNYFRLDIYYSKIGVWRRCGEHVEWPSFELFSKGVYCNGSIHWGSKRDGFKCFDINQECFKLMPNLPVFRAGSSTIRYFGESSGNLFIIDARVLEFDVFEMERDYSGWVAKFQVNLGRVFGMYPDIFSEPVCVFCNEKTNISLISVVRELGGDLCLIIHVPGKILSYNMKSERIEMIRDRFLGNVERIIPALVKGFGGYQHFESLACV